MDHDVNMSHISVGVSFQDMTRPALTAESPGLLSTRHIQIKRGGSPLLLPAMVQDHFSSYSESRTMLNSFKELTTGSFNVLDCKEQVSL
jgi:hypothetical protein